MQRKIIVPCSSKIELDIFLLLVFGCLLDQKLFEMYLVNYSLANPKGEMILRMQKKSQVQIFIIQQTRKI